MDIGKSKENKISMGFYESIILGILLVHAFFSKSIASLFIKISNQRITIFFIFLTTLLFSFTISKLGDHNMDFFRYTFSLAYVVMYNYDFYFQSQQSLGNEWNIDYCLAFINLVCQILFFNVNKTSLIFVFVAFNL